MQTECIGLCFVNRLSFDGAIHSHGGCFCTHRQTKISGLVECPNQYKLQNHCCHLKAKVTNGTFNLDGLRSIGYGPGYAPKAYESYKDYHTASTTVPTITIA
eukprot:2396703-Amphidinium_carterae.1